MDENRIILDRDIDFVDDKTFEAAQTVKKVLDQQLAVNQQVMSNTIKLDELEKKVDEAISNVAKEL